MGEWFPSAVYLLCFAASATCALLLFRGYRKSAARLLLWSALCFLLLAANNFVVIVDMLILTEHDLRVLRLLLSMAAIGLLLFGLIWHREERQ